jgi:hypothetical protein
MVCATAARVDYCNPNLIGSGGSWSLDLWTLKAPHRLTEIRFWQAHLFMYLSHSDTPSYLYL